MVPVAETILAVVAVINNGIPVGVVMCHHMWWRWHRHFHIVITTLDMHGVWFLDVDHLRWLLHGHWHPVMHDDWFHHGGTGHMNFHILWWARHMVAVVDGVHDWSMSWHWFWHWDFDMLNFGDSVVVVFVHDGMRAVLLVLVTAPARMCTRPNGIGMSVHPLAVVLFRWGHHFHCVDESWLLGHLDLYVVVDRNLPVDGVVVAAHHRMDFRRAVGSLAL